MKKLFTQKILVALLFLLSTVVGKAQLLTETFSYTPDATSGLAAQSGLAWSIINTGDSILVDAGNLSYSGFAPSTGNKIAFGGAGTDYYRPFTSQTTGTVYYSFLINVSTLGGLTTTGGYLGGFIDGTTSNFSARLWTRLSGTANYNIGINPGSTAANTQWSATVLSPGTTYLVVASLEFITGATNDVARLWINPVSLGATTAPTADATATNTVADPSSIQRFFFRQDNASNTPGALFIDELRVGVSWAEVTPTVPAGATLGTSGSATGLSTVQGTASASGLFNVTGTDLTGFPGVITATASSTDFEVSNNNSTWGPSTTIAYSAATLAATPVYVRISATAALGPVSGTVSLSGGGATAITANVGGNVLNPEPTTQASNIVVSDITDNGFTINWTNGNGASRLVAVRASTSTQVLPLDGSVYTTSVGGGNTVWYNSTAGGPVTVTGLTAGTNYTVHAYEYNGTAVGTTNYLTTTAVNNPVSTQTTGVSPNIQQGFFTSVATPVYGGRSTFRTAIVAIGTISGLTPNTTYRYFSNASAATDFGTSTTAGTLILNDYTVSTPSFFTASTGNLSGVNTYGKFTSDATGKFTGTFGFFPSTNERFNAGAQVYPTVTIGEDVSPYTTKFRFALDQYVTMMDWGTSSTAGSLLKGLSSAAPNNVVAIWKSIDGNPVTTRPQSMTLVENTAATTALPAPYDETDGAWNTIMPNDNPEGIRLIQQIGVTGVVLGCNSDADGIWPSSASTSDPANGSATGIQITITDAPVNAGVCFGLLPVSMTSFTAQKVNGTVSLKWSTSQELNSRNFIIERSSDNRTWTAIASVAAAGFSNVTKNYVYTDAVPAKGLNYYRIKQVDVDSRAVTSMVRTVLFSEGFSIVIGPNPATEFVNVYVSKNDLKPTQVIVTDLNGRIMQHYNTPDQLIRINTTRFAKGVYTVKVISSENTTTQKVIVQ